MTAMDKGTDRPRAILSNHRVRAVFKSKAPSVCFEDTFQLCPKLGKALRCGSLLQNSSLIGMKKTAGYVGDSVSDRLQVHAQGHITYGKDSIGSAVGEVEVRPLPCQLRFPEFTAAQIGVTGNPHHTAQKQSCGNTEQAFLLWLDPLHLCSALIGEQRQSGSLPSRQFTAVGNIKGDGFHPSYRMAAKISEASSRTR